MITNYKIKDNILYLYFDYNYEFGLIDIKSNIKKYIKDKKILFRGSMVAIVVSGILIGYMNIKPNESNIALNYINPYEYVIDDIKVNEELEINENETDIQEPNTLKQEVKEEVNNNEKRESNTAITTNKTEIKQEQNNKVEPKQEKVQEPKQEEVQESKEEVDNNIYVNVYRSSDIVKLELEEYIIGCVGAEMPALFNIEALKSQAIIARTYALKSIKNGRILTDNESTQSYKDNNELKSLWGSNYDTYYNKIKSAVIDTKGLYLSYNNDYIEAVYHSTSNGITESSQNVWGNYYPYLVNVISEYDIDSPTYIQDKFINYEEISNKLKLTINNETQINIASKTSGNRVEYIDINGTILKGLEFRNKLGLRSNDFDIKKEENGITFTTRGYGHGVGMSQYGANGMAKKGYNYKDILNHYYPGTILKNIY